MPKKAVSPLIATVLIIGFAIALSGIMMTWGTSFVKDVQERSEKSSLKDIACTKDVGLNIKSATVLGNKIKLVIENLGQMDMDKLNILLIGSDGGDNIETGSGISAGGIQSFSVALDPNKIGTFKQVEIIPYITFEGEQIVCKDAVDKEENLGIDTDGLVAYYKLDGDAKDSAGNNNGVINGNPATVSGVFGSALNFDGNDYVDSTSSNSLNFGTGVFSVSAWVKPAYQFTLSTDGDFDVISKGNGESSASYPGWKLNFDKWQGWQFLLGDGTNNDKPYEGETALAKWYYLVGVRNSQNVNLYVDGNLVSTVANNQYDTTRNGVPIKIGVSYTFQNQNYFNGIIDEVMIYNKAKTY